MSSKQSAVDKAMSEIGTKNCWLWFWFNYVSFLKSLLSVLTMLAFLWVANQPTEYRCYLPLDEMDNNNTNTNDSVTINKEELLHNYIPKTQINGKLTWSQCEKYSQPGDNGSQLIDCNNNYYYNDHFNRKTIVIEWNLVCNRGYLSDLSSSGFYVISYLGVFTICYLSDRIGRRIVFLSCFCLLSILSGITSFSVNIGMFIGLRIISGALQQGVFMSGYCLGVELFPRSYRHIAGLADEFHWVAAALIQVLIVYFIREWRLYFLITGFPCLLFLSLFYWLPESVPWLMDRGKIHQAAQMLTIADKYHKKRGLTYFKELLTNYDVNDENNQIPLYQPLTILCHPLLFIWTVCLFFIWFTSALLYYSVSNYGVNVGDPYINTTMFTLTESIAYITIIPTTKKFGRKIMLIVSFLFCSLMFILCATYNGIVGFNDTNNNNNDNNPLFIIIFLTLARFFVSMVFALIFLYTSELYPTSLRTTGVGFGSSSARLGMFFAPYIGRIAYYNQSLFFLIMCLMAIVCVLLIFFILPESSHRLLPNTLEDIEQWLNNNNEKENKNDSKVKIVSSWRRQFDAPQFSCLSYGK